MSITSGKPLKTNTVVFVIGCILLATILLCTATVLDKMDRVNEDNQTRQNRTESSLERMNGKLIQHDERIYGAH